MERQSEVSLDSEELIGFLFQAYRTPAKLSAMFQWTLSFFKRMSTLFVTAKTLSCIKSATLSRQAKLIGPIFPINELSPYTSRLST